MTHHYNSAPRLVDLIPKAQVTQVEIDPDVIQAAKDFLPSIWQHPYLDTGGHPAPLHIDPRLTVLNLDALQYLQERADQKLYDLVIVDASDPIGRYSIP